MNIIVRYRIILSYRKFVYLFSMFFLNSIRKVFCLLMALLMFFTSVGIILDLHYCQGELKTFNVFGKARTCHEVGQGMKNCPHHKQMMASGPSNGTTISKKGCCSGKTLHLQSSQDKLSQTGNTVVISTQLQHFVVAFLSSFFKSTITEKNSPQYVHYKPPLIPKDICVLLETYLL